MREIPTALTIAGSDPSGGAGIQADLKTFQEHQAYGMSVITSITAQNTTGVSDVYHIPLKMINEQIESITEDIPVHAFKTGMLANVDIMEVVKNQIPSIKAPYIMDPVMVAASGDSLVTGDAESYLKEHLLPLTTLITPNVPEAEVITGTTIENLQDMEKAARLLVEEHGAKSALVKGGHLDSEQEAMDVLYLNQEFYHFTSKRIDTTNSHGTGCTLSAAITANLAKGDKMVTAIERAKDYITQAIEQSFDLGKGSGPTNHWAPRTHKEE